MARVDGLLKHYAMEATADFLRRGRAYAALDVATLNDWWYAACEHWREQRTKESYRDEQDLISELSPRGSDAPYDRIRPEQLEAMPAEIAANPDDQGVRAGIADPKTEST